MEFFEHAAAVAVGFALLLAALKGTQGILSWVKKPAEFKMLYYEKLAGEQTRYLGESKTRDPLSLFVLAFGNDPKTVQLESNGPLRMVLSFTINQSTDSKGFLIVEGMTVFVKPLSPSETPEQVVIR